MTSANIVAMLPDLHRSLMFLWTPADDSWWEICAWSADEEGVAVIVELTPQGWLDARQAARLRRDTLIALNRGCEAIIISGMTLRYRDVVGLAGLAALLAEAGAHSPHVPIWLCHISPDLRAAASLAALTDSWLLAADRATALDSIMRDANGSSLAALSSSSPLEAVHV